MKDQMLGKIMSMIVTVPAEWLGTLVDLLEKLTSQTGGEWFQNLKRFLRKETCWVKEIYTQFLSGAETLELDETDGKATIAKATETFPGWIDGNFRQWGCDVDSGPNEKVKVSVHEMIKDGTFSQIWNGMSDDLNSLRLTQSQIIQFVQKHRKWLRTEGYGTFFLFKVGNEFFVARVHFDDGGQLMVGVRRFSDDDVWDAKYRHRIVTPQLTLVPSVS